MGVSSDKVIYYSLNEINTSSKVFKLFMQELINKLTKDEKKIVYS